MTIKKLKIKVLVSAAVIMLTNLAHAIPNSTLSQNQRPAAIEKYFTKTVRDGKIAGAIVVVSNDQSKYIKAFGYMDKDNKIQMPQDALIPLGSMTKTVTAIAVMQLQEQGKLKLTDPIEKYIPSFSNIRVASAPDQSADEPVRTEIANKKITILDLLTHTARSRKNWCIRKPFTI
ncbi:beta-lactamase family protein [Pseudomonas sp. R4-84]